METTTRQIETPAYFPPFAGTEIGVTRVCVCGAKVQTRVSAKTNRRYVARVETRADWRGAYFRGIHTADECRTGWEAFQARIDAEITAREEREAAAARQAYVAKVLNRAKAVYGMEWLQANFNACWERLTGAVIPTA